ncbi:MAG: hypothetical protein K2W95_19910 [Candidatus Obscuribacterales bacterium]|nr:hypothetical protein [Candidatus Obscuribacterales bacterium]
MTQPDFEPEVAASPTSTASDRTDNSSLKQVAATWLHDWFSLPEAQNKQLVETLPSLTIQMAAGGAAVIAGRNEPENYELRQRSTSGDRARWNENDATKSEVKRR